MLSGRLLVFYMGMVCTPPASLLVAYWSLTSSGAGCRGLGLHITVWVCLRLHVVREASATKVTRYISLLY
jgi:hypothetical protein